MAKKLALVNMKGGVGKSTLAVQLAYEYAILSKYKKKVLLIDLDPQFNLSQYLLGAATYDSDILKKNFPTVWTIFEQHTHMPGSMAPAQLDPNSVVYHAKSYTGGGLIDLIPSRLELAFSLRNPAQKEDLLARLIPSVEKNYDLVIIDCPPTESLLTTAAYLTSDHVLVPVKPEYLSSIGLPLLNNSLNEFRSRYGSKNPQVAGVVFNFDSDYAPEERKSKSDVSATCSKFGWHLFKNPVPYSKSFPKSAREGSALRWTSYRRSSTVARFTLVADELAGRIGI